MLGYVASLMEIVLVGLNHRTAPVEVRERVSYTAEQASRAASELRSRGILEETLVLSTCNRSEIYGVPPETSHESAAGLSSFLSEFHQVQADILSVSLYHHYDRHAVRHLFRVSAGLDSMMLGEAEILGQVREAYKFAYEQGATGPVAPCSYANLYASRTWPRISASPNIIESSPAETRNKWRTACRS